MGLVGTWSRQVARAAGASLIAPLVLLLAAGVVASGGDLGGLGSLRQIASGPALPDTGRTTASRESPIRSTEIVGTVSPAGRAAPRSAPPTGEVASAAPAATAAAPSAAPSLQAERRVRTERAEPGPSTRGTQGVLVGDPTLGPPADGPNDVLQETTQGLGEALLEPLGPVTNELLDLLRILVPPPR